MIKLLIICGPTATGKTDLGIRLAQKYNGEIISADSRQVYKGMDIVTGKDIPKKSPIHRVMLNSVQHPVPASRQVKKIPKPALPAGRQVRDDEKTIGYRFKNNIPIWLVDIVSPDYPFNVGEYSKLAKEVIRYIKSRNKLPIIVGGTGLYVNSIIKPLSLTQIPPNERLRNRLDTLNRQDLADELIKLNPQKWNDMNPSDRLNPRRLIRAIEISTYLQSQTTPMNRFIGVEQNVLSIGLTVSGDILFDRIDKRVDERIKKGSLDEIKKLRKKGYSWDLHSFSSTGIRQLKEYFEDRESIEQVIKKWKLAEKQYAKRQLTWFKKEKNIHWFDITDTDYHLKIEELVQKWYTSS